jgi:Cdc6-like AAA superfamily ATPase
MQDVTMNPNAMNDAIGVSVMKKAMDVQAREVLSVLESAATQSQTMQSPAVEPQKVAALTGMGQNIDVKG